MVLFFEMVFIQGTWLLQTLKNTHLSSETWSLMGILFKIVNTTPKNNKQGLIAVMRP